jgi:hypothetical protein
VGGGPPGGNESALQSSSFQIPSNVPNFMRGCASPVARAWLHVLIAPTLENTTKKQPLRGKA